jgi:murein DD-endopeptidase MepM/ murein hydrolase activator NlpD
MTRKNKLITGAAVLVAIAAVYIFYPSSSLDTELDGLRIEEEMQKQAEFLYGIPKGEYNTIQDKVKPNQNLASLLSAHDINPGNIVTLSTKFENVFDTRSMKFDRPYTIMVRESDTMKSAAYLIYEKSNIEFIVYDLEHDTVYKGKKEVSVQRKHFAGTITSNLSETLQDAGVDVALAYSMASIYDCTIDFYKLQQNDFFKVIYIEKMVEGKYVGIDKIEAIEFTHNSKPFYAFYFEQDEVGNYFDEKAQNMRKAFLKAPLKYGYRISSKYNKNRLHPVLKVNRPHLGTDYAAAHGTPIITVGDGVVLEASFTKGNGNYVKVKHNGTFTTQYLHMSKFASGIKPGKRVSQGDVIGYVGSTGLATGPHVCFRFWKNGVQVDPFKVMPPPAEPVAKKNMERFNERVAVLKKELEGIGKELTASLK